VRVQIVDPSAYTPPYDHALCQALGAAGAEVELFTSRFAYGPVAPAQGYERRELFYRAARFAPRSRAQRLTKLAEHVPDMLRYRHAARAADVVHFQWLPVQHLDRHLLPRAPAAAGARRPLVLTAHDVMPREPRPGQLSAQRRLYDRFDAIVVHSEHGRERLTNELGVDPNRVHVIPHGVFAHLAADPPSAAAGGRAGGWAPFQTDLPVVLCFGLMRPYKGIDLLLQAWDGIEDTELWIVGMPRMDLTALDAAHGGVLSRSRTEAGRHSPFGSHPRFGQHATRGGRALSSLPGLVQDRQQAHGPIRFVPRFITDSELPAYFQRADLVVLPYRQIDQSGVLFTALAFGKPLLLSDVGGFPEIAATGAARIVPAGDPIALRNALQDLLGDPAALADMAARARAAAAGKYAWSTIARQTLDLYRSLGA
jgi:glycosyltransferase involved in cell wall biosynthesis